jgi:hypothetical protein
VEDEQHVLGAEEEVLGRQKESKVCSWLQASRLSAALCDFEHGPKLHARVPCSLRHLCLDKRNPNCLASLQEATKRDANHADCLWLGPPGLFSGLGSAREVIASTPIPQILRRQNYRLDSPVYRPSRHDEGL